MYFTFYWNDYFYICRMNGKWINTIQYNTIQGGRGMAIIFFNLSIRRGGVSGQRQAPAALPPGKRAGTHCIRGWVGPRAGLDGCGKPLPTGIRSSDRPARSKSLYRLRYPVPHSYMSHILRFSVCLLDHKRHTKTCSDVIYIVNTV